jgi:hypothetical protein
MAKPLHYYLDNFLLGTPSIQSTVNMHLSGEACRPGARCGYFLRDVTAAFSRVSCTRKVTIFLIKSNGIGPSSGNCTEPLALL